MEKAVQKSGMESAEELIKKLPAKEQELWRKRIKLLYEYFVLLGQPKAK